MNTLLDDERPIQIISFEDWEEILKLYERELREPTPDMPDTPGAFFAYGIFRDPDTTASSIGRDVAGYWARLDGFRRVESGPAYIIPSPGDHVIGVLYEGIEPEDWPHLDSVEGVKVRHYDRVQVTVTRLWDGASVPAQAYQAGPSSMRRIQDYPSRPGLVQAPDGTIHIYHGQGEFSWD